MGGESDFYFGFCLAEHMVNEKKDFGFGVWVWVATVDLCLGLNGGNGFQFQGWVPMAMVGLCLGFNSSSGFGFGIQWRRWVWFWVSFIAVRKLFICFC